LKNTYYFQREEEEEDDEEEEEEEEDDEEEEEEEEEDEHDSFRAQNCAMMDGLALFDDLCGTAVKCFVSRFLGSFVVPSFPLWRPYGK